MLNTNRSKSARMKKIMTTETYLGIFIIVVMVIMGILNRDFYNITNMMLFLNRYSYMLIAAIGMNMIIITANIDISAGSQISVVCIFLALIGSTGLNIIGLFIVAIIMGGILGLINGLFITKIKIPAIVVTLATMQLFSGILPIIFEGSIYGLPTSFTSFAKDAKLFGAIPASFIIAVVIAIIAILFMRYSKFSKKIYAIGNDKEGARRAGIDVNKVLIIVYIIGGVLFAISGVIIATASQRVTTNMGVGTEMIFIAAAILGGTSVAGGRGTILGTVLGTFLLSAVYSAIVYLGIHTSWSDAFTGAIILVAIVTSALADIVKERRKAKPDAKSMIIGGVE